MAPFDLNFRTIWGERSASRPPAASSAIRVGLKPRLGIFVDEKSLAIPEMTSRFVGQLACSLLTTPTNHVVYIFTT